MNNNKKNNKKKIVIIISIIIAVIMLLLLVFINKKENITLSCEQIQSDENAKLTTTTLISKNGEEIHINYSGKIELFVNNEMAYMFLSKYVETQVSKFKEINDSFATISKTKKDITYEFDFDMSAVGENEINSLLGIYTNDIQELKNHFESGGAVCEEV